MSWRKAAPVSRVRWIGFEPLLEISRRIPDLRFVEAEIRELSQVEVDRPAGMPSHGFARL